MILAATAETNVALALRGDGALAVALSFGAAADIDAVTCLARIFAGSILKNHNTDQHKSCGANAAPGSTASYSSKNSKFSARLYALWSVLKPLAVYSLCVLIALTVARALLVGWQFERVTEVDMLATVFVQGLRFDLLILGLTLAVPLIAFPVLASNRMLVPAWRWLLRLYLPAMLLFVVFMECSTPSFVTQFDSRPNVLFLEYLDHPKEVAATLWATQKLSLTLAFMLCVFVVWFFNRKLKAMNAAMQPASLVMVVLAAPVLIFVCVAMVRSTLDHRPVNPSTVALSKDPLVNELALSSAYTVLYAAYEIRHEAEGGFRYAEIDDDVAVQRVRDGMLIAPDDFVSQQLPTLHRQQATFAKGGKKNLVIILEESLGAEFVGALGGLDLTPNLDSLASVGLWFSNLYATGTRSVRGIEAVVSGFTPTPMRSVVKLGKSQREFFTLGQLLANAGYDTSFLYGGEAQFDNMRRFFMNNGFDRVVDKNDYADPVFTGSWGVSDEDLLNRAHEEFSAAGDKPFFSLVFSSSNHSPFEFPDGRISLYDKDKATVNNAVKYADYALGSFFDKARTSSYWSNTVFLVVADHNSRTYGPQVVPIDRFHVPALILGGSIEPAVYEPIASQIDLAPTLLSLIGVSAQHPMIGHDLTRADMQQYVGRAIMQYNATQAYMEGDRVIVLRKDLPIKEFLYEHNKLAAQTSVDPELAERAVAHSVWSSMAYHKKLYRLQ